MTVIVAVTDFPSCGCGISQLEIGFDFRSTDEDIPVVADFLIL